MTARRLTMLVLICSVAILAPATSAAAAPSVGAGDIEKGAVRSKHIKKNAIGGKHVKRAALRISDVKGLGAKLQQVELLRRQNLVLSEEIAALRDRLGMVERTAASTQSSLGALSDQLNGLLAGLTGPGGLSSLLEDVCAQTAALTSGLDGLVSGLGPLDLSVLVGALLDLSDADVPAFGTGRCG